MADRRYWDSACFIAWFKQEAGRQETCGSILQAAENGDLEIVTSAFTITEVLLPKGGQRLPPELRAMVRSFFRRPAFVIVQVDRYLAEMAQDYFWDHGVKPKDAIHVASAVHAGVPTLETYDGGLIKLSGQVGGKPPLQIREPVPIHQGEQVDLLDGLEDLF